MTSRRKSQKHSAQKRAQQRQTVRDLGAMVAKEFRNLSAQWHAAMSLHTYLTTGKRMGPLQGYDSVTPATLPIPSEGRQAHLASPPPVGRCSNEPSRC